MIFFTRQKIYIYNELSDNYKERSTAFGGGGHTTMSYWTTIRNGPPPLAAEDILQ